MTLLLYYLFIVSNICSCFLLSPTLLGHRKCRELWPDKPIEFEKVFNLFLDMFLLLLPLFVLLATYFMITKTLWQGIRTERELKDQLTNYTKCLRKYLIVIYHSFDVTQPQ
jgi:hypothetical protein